MYPHLDLLDELIRICGWPTLLGVIVWAVRTYDSGRRELGAIGTDAKAARDGVMDMKMNHLAHLQTGIEQVAKSNDTAVEILREIKTGITVLTDRFPRA
jgi:hypothetical protein